MFFSKFKPVNDEGVERAIMLACLTNPHKYLGGTACLRKGRLIIAITVFNLDAVDSSSYVSDLDERFLQTLIGNIPEKYGNKVDLWPEKKFDTEVPEQIRSKSCDFSVYRSHL